MTVTIQPTPGPSQPSALADAWASLSAAVPTQIHETTAHLQKVLQTAAVTTTQVSLAALTGPTGHVLAATVAELACDAAEHTLLQATDPLRNSSTTNAMRDTMRAEIHQRATSIVQDQQGELGAPLLSKPTTERRGGLLSERPQTEAERSPLFDATFGPQCRRAKEHTNKKRDATDQRREGLLPKRLGLL
jgi:hypothetical protein